MKHQGSGDPRLSRGQEERLERYVQLLLDRAVPAGMVGRADATIVRERHVDDALRGVPLLPADGCVIDVGSGAGLPGIPLAIAVPGARFLLVEARRSRAAFLELVTERLRLRNVEVFAGRLEDADGVFDAAVARAFAAPARTWDATARFLPTGRLIYWAGAAFTLDEVPDGVHVEVFRDPVLANTGPLVIMTRQ